MRNMLKMQQYSNPDHTQVSFSCNNHHWNLINTEINPQATIFQSFGCVRYTVLAHTFIDQLFDVLGTRCQTNIFIDQLLGVLGTQYQTHTFIDQSFGVLDTQYQTHIFIDQLFGVLGTRCQPHIFMDQSFDCVRYTVLGQYFHRPIV